MHACEWREGQKEIERERISSRCTAEHGV